MSITDERLNRIEEKIDKLSEAMISLARAEEKLIGLEGKYLSQYERVNRLSEKIDNNQSDLDGMKVKVDNYSKFNWLIITALAANIVASILM